MALSTLEDKDIDEKNNPVGNQTNDLLNKIENNPNAPSKQNNDSPLSDKEVNSNSDFTNNISGDSNSGLNNKFNLKNISTKKGLVGGGMVLGASGLFFAFSSIFMSMLGLNHMTAMMTDSLNDQLANMHIRSNKLLVKKVNSLNKVGMCKPINIRCKFSTMSNKMVKNFEKAGIKVLPPKTGSAKGIPGRNKIGGFEFPDGTKVTDPSGLRKAMKENPSVRSSLRQGFNSKFMGFRDKLSTKILNKLGIDRSKKISGKNDAERKKSIEKNVKSDGDSNTTDKNKLADNNDDGDGNKDKKGKAREKVTNLEDGASSSKKFGGIASKMAKHGSAAMKGLMITGLSDTACTLYGTIRAVSAAAKVIRAVQLAQFAMVFLNTADAIKMGEAKPEDVEYAMNKLTSIDTNKKIIDENDNEIDNPFFQKSAFDSPGYKTAAYNAAPILTTRSIQYMVGGGLAGKLDYVMDAITSAIPNGKNNIKSACGAIQSWWTRGTGLVAGLFLGIGTLGWSTAILGGASIVLSFAAPYVEAMLADIIAGQVVGDFTKGVDAGDAIFVGSSVIMGNTAMASGMKPASISSLKDYQAISNQIKDTEIALDIYDAKKEPFNIHNKYSTLGSFMHNLFLTQSKSNSPLFNIASLSFGASRLININSAAKAAKEFNEHRFSRCTDEAYQEIGIDADVFCNVRYASSKSELNADTDAVLEWMINNNQIEEATGEAKPDSNYAKWLQHCTSREESGWGESTDAESQNDKWETGENCMNDKDGSSAVYSIKQDQEGAFLADTNPSSVAKHEDMGAHQIFRVYTMDKRVADGMDDGVDDEIVNSSSTASGEGLDRIVSAGSEFFPFGYTQGHPRSMDAKEMLDNIRNGTFKSPKALMDCSSFVRYSIFSAFNHDIGNITTRVMDVNEFLQKISIDEVGPGDIAWRAGHTEVVVSREGSSVTTQGAHCAGCNPNIGPSGAQPWTEWTDYYRYTGPQGEPYK